MPEDKLTNNELKLLMDNLTDKFDKFEEKFDKFCLRIEDHYVSKIEFKPYQKAMYVVGTAVLLAIVSLGLDKLLK